MLSRCRRCRWRHHCTTGSGYPEVETTLVRKAAKEVGVLLVNEKSESLMVIGVFRAGRSEGALL